LLALQIKFLFALIYLSIGVRLAALVRAYASDLGGKHPAFIILLIVTALRSVATVALPGALYTKIFTASLWPVSILEALVVIEAFWILAAHFRNIRGFGWRLIGLIAVIAVLTATFVRFARSFYSGFLSVPLVLQMFTQSACIIALLLSLIFFRQFRAVPIRPNAIRHVVALGIFFALNFASAATAQLSHGKALFTTNLLASLATISAFGLWAIKMTRQGEALPFAPPPPISQEQFDAAEAEHRAAEADLKQAGDQAMRKALELPEISPDDPAAPPDPPAPEA